MPGRELDDVSAHRTRTNERRPVDHPHAELVQAVEDAYAEVIEDRQ